MTRTRPSPTPWVALAALALGGASVRALEADQILSYNWGNFVVRPQLDLTGSFTDNVFYGNDDLLTANGLPVRPKESDYITIISPGLRVQYGRDDFNRVTVQYHHDEVFYFGNFDDNTRQDRIDLSQRFQFGKFLLTGTDQINFLSSFIGGSAQTLNRNLIDRMAVVADHRLVYDFSEKTDMYFDGRYDLTDYDEGVALFDQNNLRGTLGGTYKFSELLGLFVEGFYGQTATEPNLAVQTPSPYSQFFGGYVGARGQFTPKLDGSLKVGYETRDFPSATVVTATADSPAVGLSLTYLAGPLTTLRLSYTRSTGIAAQFGRQSYIGDTVDFNLNQSIGTSGKWLLTAGGRYGRSDVSELINPTSVIPQHVDATYSANLALVYQPQAWWSVALAYSFEKFDSDGQILLLDTSNNIIGLSPYLVDYTVNMITLRVSIGY